MSCGGFNWVVLGAKNCNQAPLFVVPGAENCIQEPLYVVPSANECGSQAVPVVIVPAKPTGLIATNIGNTSFTLNWNPDATATSFTATWGTYNGIVTGNTAQFSGLPILTTYSCLVTAINSNGSVKSDLYAVSTTDIPGNPTNIKLIQRGTTYFIISCNTVQYATSYILTWSGITFTFNATTGATQTFTFGSLNPQMAALPASTSSNCIIQPTNNAGSGSGLIGISTTSVQSNVQLLNNLFPIPFYATTTPTNFASITIPNDFDILNNPAYFNSPADATAGGNFNFYFLLSSLAWTGSNAFAAGFYFYGIKAGIPFQLNGNSSLLLNGQFFDKNTQLRFTPNPLTGKYTNWLGWIYPGAQLIMLITASDGSLDMNRLTSGFMRVQLTYNSFSTT